MGNRPTFSTARRSGTILAAAFALLLQMLVAVPVAHAASPLDKKCDSVTRNGTAIHFRVGNSNWGWTKANEKHNLWNCDVLEDVVRTGSVTNQTTYRARYYKSISYLDIYSQRVSQQVNVVVDFSNSTESGSTGTQIVGMITAYCDTDASNDLCDEGVNHPL